jgi:predicted DNA-binding antitoxin AbrB/MazE fold protein
MSQRITAVVENGLLRPTEPLPIAEGKVVELELLGPVRSEVAEERIWNLAQALDELQAEAAKYPEEWWDEFERDLNANRVNFEERE